MALCRWAIRIVYKITQEIGSFEKSTSFEMPSHNPDQETDKIYRSGTQIQ